MSRYLPEVLNALLSERRFSAEDLAKMADCSANMIYSVRNETAELSTSKVTALARALCREGDTRVAACFLPPELRICTDGEARADGRIDDEAADLASAVGSMVDAHRTGNRTRMDDSISRAQRALDNARAERDRLGG
jgi:hypothetical protein